jgi:hypothetical protein
MEIKHCNKEVVTKGENRNYHTPVSGSTGDDVPRHLKEFCVSEARDVYIKHINKANVRIPKCNQPSTSLGGLSLKPALKKGPWNLMVPSSSAGEQELNELYPPAP